MTGPTAHRLTQSNGLHSQARSTKSSGMTTEHGLTASSWYRDASERWVAVISGIPGFDPRHLVGRSVMIDHRSYVVRAVETNAVPDATGRTFGLRVGPAVPPVAAA